MNKVGLDGRLPQCFYFTHSTVVVMPGVEINTAAQNPVPYATIICMLV